MEQTDSRDIWKFVERDKQCWQIMMLALHRQPARGQMVQGLSEDWLENRLCRHCHFHSHYPTNPHAGSLRHPGDEASGFYDGPAWIWRCGVLPKETLVPFARQTRVCCCPASGL